MKWEGAEPRRGAAEPGPRPSAPPQGRRMDLPRRLRLHGKFKAFRMIEAIGRNAYHAPVGALAPKTICLP